MFVPIMDALLRVAMIRRRGARIGIRHIDEIVRDWVEPQRTGSEQAPVADGQRPTPQQARLLLDALVHYGALIRAENGTTTS